MYLYLLLSLVYSASSLAIEPTISVLDAINASSHDENFKCSYLRSSQLFVNTPSILKDCGSFKRAQSLQVVDKVTVDSGLCILYYNNFENLCYLTNNATEPIGLISVPVPEEFSINIDVVCETLKNNTNFVNHTRPGIIAISDRLSDGHCTPLCTDFDGIKPICSLSAYMLHIAKLLSVENKKVIATSKVSDTNKKKSLTVTNINPNGDILPKSAIKEPTNKKDKQVTIISQSTSSNNVVAPNLPQKPLLSAETSPPKDSKTDILEQQLLPVETSPPKDSKTNILHDTLQIKEHPKLEKPAPVKEENTKNSLEQPNDNNAKDALNSKAAKTTLPKSIKTPNEDLHNDLRNSEQNLEIPKKTEDIHNMNDKSTTQAEIPNDFNIPPDQKDYENTNNKENNEIVYGKENKDDGSESDFELGDGAVPPIDDPIKDYNNEFVPKPSEVKSKSDIEKSSEKLKPLQTDEERYSISANYQNQNIDDSDSYFFSYFMMFCVIFICGYVAYHNKQKILALVIEGRRGRRPSRSRRPNSANYHKLDSNLEEAVTSTCNKSAPQVIY